MTEFKCGTCALRRTFPHRQDCSQAGWLVAEVLFAGTLRYVVRCPEHVPGWAKEVVNERGIGSRRAAGK